MRIFFVVVCIAVFTTSLPAQSEVTRKGNYIYIKTRLDQLVDRNITDVLPEVIGLFVDRIKDIKAEERYEVESSERTREILENVDPFLDIVNERIFEHRGEQDEEHAFRLSWSSILPTGFILFGGAGAKGGTTIKGRGAISAGIFVIPKRVTQINIYTKEKRVSWEFAWSIIGWPQISAGVGTDVGASVGNRWGLGLSLIHI